MDSERFNIPNYNGYYICSGIGGALTGKSVDIGIIVDPIKNMLEARSETTKKTIQDWYNSVFLTRLSKNSGQLIIATRWDLDDLIGYILDKQKDNKNLKVLKYQAIINNKFTFCSLNEKLHPLNQLLEIKNNIDDYT